MIASITTVKADLKIKKIVNDNYKTGDNIKIKYEITNNYNQEIRGILTDENIINNSGYIIKCLSLTIPPKTSGILDLNNKINLTLIPEKKGEYQLGKAKITYKDPELNIIETSESNNPKIKVKEGNEVKKNLTIKVIDLCNQEQKKRQEEQEQQKKNQPTREEAQRQKQEQEKKQEQEQQELNNRFQQQSNLQKKLSRTQQSYNQNSNSVKKSLENELRRKQENNKELSRKIENNSKIKEEIKKMREKGFRLMNKTIQATNNNTGSFDYTFKNKNGTTEHITGEMQDNKIKRLENTHELKQEKNYQELKKELEKQGFKEEKTSLMNNKLTSEFRNPRTGETANITGTTKNNQLKNPVINYGNKRIREILNENRPNNKALKELMKKLNKTSSDLKLMQKPGEKHAELIDKKGTIKKMLVDTKNNEILTRPEENKKKKNILTTIIITIITLTIIYFFYKKKKKRKNNDKEKERKGSDNKKRKKRISEAMKLLEKSKQLYNKGRIKEAYATMGLAIRYYYSAKANDSKEITNNELLRIIKKEYPNLIRKAEEVIREVEAVEYANQKPSKKFNKIYEKSRRMIRVK